MYRIVATTFVPCCGELHRIGLRSNGEFVYFRHTKENMRLHQLMTIIGAEPCGCEVFCQKLLAASSPPYSFFNPPSYAPDFDFMTDLPLYKSHIKSRLRSSIRRFVIAYYRVKLDRSVLHVVRAISRTAPGAGKRRRREVHELERAVPPKLTVPMSKEADSALDHIPKYLRRFSKYDLRGTLTHYRYRRMHLGSRPYRRHRPRRRGRKNTVIRT